MLLVHQVIAGEDAAFVLGLDAAGRLLGVEVFGAGGRLHPDLLAVAEHWAAGGHIGAS